MLILDGYSRRAVLKNGSKLIYRPFLSIDKQTRRRELWEISFLNSQSMVDQMLMRQVVEWDGSLDEIRQDFQEFLNLLYGVIEDFSGEKWVDVEGRMRQNLYDGVYLLRTNPKLASRSCDSCQKLWYLDNGDVLKDVNGVEQVRPYGALPSCRTEFGCAKGTPENQKSLNPQNRWAYHHFLECESTGTFPDDRIVRHNAEVIRRAVRDAEKSKGLDNK